MRRVIGLLLGALLLGGCAVTFEDKTAEPTAATSSATSQALPEPSPNVDAPVAPPTQEAAPAPGSGVLAVLETLEVKGKAADSGYDREGKYGEAWSDVDGNNCRTRDDILKRDMYNILTTGGCKVESGILEDPYSGETIFFEQGERSSEVQIDHVVALKNSWLTGAQSWDQQKRVEFANDPLNLLAVKGSLNQQKGAGDSATWLPPRSSYRCEYVSRQIEVKAKYGLWVTPAEKEAMVRVLGNCGEEPSPAAPAAGEPPAVEENPMPVAGGDPQYPSCKAAKADGYGPYVQGVDVEYDWYRDGDADGTVCE